MHLSPVTPQEFDAVYSAIEDSFPREERRDREAARRLLLEGRYSLYHTVEEGERRGCVSLWRFPDFVFVEHLLTYPAYRNGGMGARVLSCLKAEGLPLVLEAEPPLTEMAIRRLGFYRRAGFLENSIAYLQPPYREGDAPTPLVLLSYPAPLADPHTAAAVIYREVYGKNYAKA